MYVRARSRFVLFQLLLAAESDEIVAGAGGDASLVGMLGSWRGTRLATNSNQQHCRPISHNESNPCAPFLSLLRSDH
jgi:hypothetical protein